MSFNNAISSQNKTASAKKLMVTSYDLGHEHSVEHWIELRIMVDEVEEKTSVNVDGLELVPAS